MNLNKTTETEINKLMGSLDIKLETNNQLGLKLAQNKSPKSNEELTEIINTNFNIVRTGLKYERSFFFLGIIEIFLIILLMIYFSKKTFGII